MGKKRFEEYRPGLVMVGLQFIYAGNALLAKAAFTQGLSSNVFIAYRQVIAALALAPAAIIATRKRGRAVSEGVVALGIKGFSLVFLAALVGATFNQFFYYQGLQLSSTSTASAISNIIPGITFLMAASVGLEKVEVSSRSMAKVFGTIICVGGAVSMALFKGPKLTNVERSHILNTIFHSVGEDWIIGCLFLLGSSSCWSLWLIIQVPICKNYLDPLLLSTWMCFLSSLQSAALTIFLEPDLRAWRIGSAFEFLCCLYAGIIGSAVTYYAQSWCISRRGPVYSAMFSPLCTVIVTTLAFLLLHEQVYVGSLIGAAAVVGGLYVVLWGKAKDLDMEMEQKPGEDHTNIRISVDKLSKTNDEDVMEPLLVQGLLATKCETRQQT